jgi:predicted nucleotidyltransferase
MEPLSESFLQSLIDRLDVPDVVGITLSGSHARGEVDRYSDVDLSCYVQTLPDREADHNTLRYWDARLVSIHSTTIETVQAELKNPEHAIWVIPSICQARILLDKNGTIAALKQFAESLCWADLQPAADEFAAEELMGFAEEAHKILSGLAREQESTVLNAVWGLLVGMLRALAVQRGLLIRTENEYFDLIQGVIGRDSAWTTAFRLASGCDNGPVNLRPYKLRGAAALALYRETAAMLDPIIPDHHREVIASTLALISEAGY